MSEERDPRCVLVVGEPSVATAVAELLTNKGFPAEVVTPGLIATPGDSLGLSEETLAALEVRVVNPDHAEPARKVIEEEKAVQKEMQALKERRAARTGTVAAVCEECGQSSEWPASQMGTTQDCPHCGAYMDIPDPEERWNDEDFAGEAAEDETA